MSDVYFHSGKQMLLDAGDALSLAIVSAINGREASVHCGGELMWHVEADTKGEDDPHHPAIVHFRGASLHDAVADLVQHDPEAIEVTGGAVAAAAMHLAKSDKT
jgi:hypothetical protein